jgi:hypothetical protein
MLPGFLFGVDFFFPGNTNFPTVFGILSGIFVISMGGGSCAAIKVLRQMIGMKILGHCQCMHHTRTMQLECFACYQPLLLDDFV